MEDWRVGCPKNILWKFWVGWDSLVGKEHPDAYLLRWHAFQPLTLTRSPHWHAQLEGGAFHGSNEHLPKIMMSEIDHRVENLGSLSHLLSLTKSSDMAGAHHVGPSP